MKRLGASGGKIPNNGKNLNEMEEVDRVNGEFNMSPYTEIGFRKQKYSVFQIFTLINGVIIVIFPKS